MPKKITMSDIAKELGISTVTVSKALSGQKGVGEELRQKIMEIAKERGYQKSFAASQNEGYKIGVLIGGRYIGNIDSFYGHMYQIFSAKAAKMGSFTMLEILSDDDEKKLVLPNIIGDGTVDAIVIMGALSEEYLNMLDDKLKTPTFYMDFSDRKHQKDSVVSGSYYGSYILTNYLFDKGHTDIGYVGTILATSSITDRYLGYARAMMEHGIEINKNWILNDRDINN
ncbi:MAG: LacI family DNA-binding transcriptional regulator, partial [Butyrivibrio sp.]|uniref:LacI family DNA-binding transcriptional regulator n=1 Tax=Butyrivibrio sp. TaxID=28121 RepID=UPI0025F891F7